MAEKWDANLQVVQCKPLVYDGGFDPSQRPTIRLGNRRHHYMSLISKPDSDEISKPESDDSRDGSGDETITARCKRKIPVTSEAEAEARQRVEAETMTKGAEVGGNAEPRYKPRGKGLSGGRLSSTTTAPEVVDTLSTWKEQPNERMSVRPSTIAGYGLFAEVRRTREV